MDNSNLSRVVLSKAGRDAKKYLIIVGIKNDDYVYISDGRLRRTESPKLKKIKHLELTDMYSEEIKNILISGDKVSNIKILKFLQSITHNKEV
ncbi:MAG: KOW domain-containing RNA-binding protein [Bacillota bacterium]|nr:KOW domain-containing RNA-binding protein [Bacillota bacterium]